MSEKPKFQGPAMLPGMAMIAFFMLILALFSAFEAVRGPLTTQARYLVLPMATLVVLGVFGFLGRRRWGWAILLGGCVMTMLGYVWVYRTMHDLRPLVMAGFFLVFFLYLVRDEVRIRMR